MLGIPPSLRGKDGRAKSPASESGWRAALRRGRSAIGRHGADEAAPSIGSAKPVGGPRFVATALPPAGTADASEMN